VRLTVEFLRELYQETGFVPVQAWYLFTDLDVVAADPFYALYHRNYGRFPKDLTFLEVREAIPELRRADPDYIDGFELGWHGTSVSVHARTPQERWPEAFMQGFLDGQAAVRELDAQCPNLCTWDDFMRKRKEEKAHV
jgi:hypothetical protein